MRAIFIRISGLPMGFGSAAAAAVGRQVRQVRTMQPARSERWRSCASSRRGMGVPRPGAGPLARVPVDHGRSSPPPAGGKPALPGKALRETWLDSEGGPASRALVYRHEGGRRSGIIGRRRMDEPPNAPPSAPPDESPGEHPAPESRGGGPDGPSIRVIRIPSEERAEPQEQAHAQPRRRHDPRHRLLRQWRIRVRPRPPGGDPLREPDRGRAAPTAPAISPRRWLPPSRRWGSSAVPSRIRLPGAGPVLLATRIEDEALPTVLGYGHGDTVRGMEERWTRGAGPWQTAREGDRLYGRGTADNKGQHTINMAALGAVLETRGRLGFNAKFMIETGEENGSAGVHDVVRANRDAFAADAFIASDGPRVRIDRPTVCLGARGATNFDLLCHLHEGGHHSGNWGGALPDPATVLTHAIAAIVGSKGRIKVKEWLPGADPQLGAHGARGRGARRRGGRPGGRPGLGGAGTHSGRERLRLELLRGAHDGDRRSGRPRERDPALGTGALPATLHRGDRCRRRGPGPPPPPRRTRLRRCAGPSAPSRQRGRVPGQPDGPRRPVGRPGTPVDRAHVRPKARGHPPDGGLDLQRRLHRHSRPSLDLGPTLLRLLPPARPPTSTFSCRSAGRPSR